MLITLRFWMSCDSPTVHSPARSLRWRNTRTRRALPRAVMLRGFFGASSAWIFATTGLRKPEGCDRERRQQSGKYRPSLAPFSLTAARTSDLSRAARQFCQCRGASGQYHPRGLETCGEGALLEVEASEALPAR